MIMLVSMLITSVIGFFLYLSLIFCFLVTGSFFDVRHHSRNLFKEFTNHNLS